MAAITQNTNYVFSREHSDDRLHPKEIIIGFSIDEIYKAYPQNDIESLGLLNDAVGETSVMLVSFFSENSRAFDRTINGDTLEFEMIDGKITDTITNSVWNYNGLAISGQMQGEQLERLLIEPGFWFEWVAFHPNTLVYGDTN